MPPTTTTSPPPSTAAVAARLAALRAEVEDGLEAFFRSKDGAAEGTLEDLAAAVEDLVRRGGKRLRPALVLVTHRSLGGEGTAAALPVALATELLHAYLLIHADIMDHAETRRGGAATHVAFRDLHHRRGWRGDGVDLGRSLAILAGDLAHGWAVELYTRGRARSGLDGTSASALDRAFHAMCEEVIGGQYLEMRLPLAGGAESPGEEELLRVLRLKSGRYSVERPVELGARLAGAGDDALAALAAWGTATGEAFQLQDDVLGTFGDPEAVGKPVASDLAEGKLTCLVHHTLARAGAADRATLLGLLGRPDLGAEEVATARDVMGRSGGLAAVRQMIADRVERARRALDAVPLDDDGREFLTGLVEYLAQRDV